MTSDALDFSFDTLLAQVRQHQERSEWEAAANLLADHAIDLLDRLTNTELVSLFSPFPQRQIERLPVLWYVAGLVNARLHHLNEAFVWFERAAGHFTRHDSRPERMVWIYLELARLHYVRDEYVEVQQYIDRAAAMMADGGTLPPVHQAFLYYMIANLCGDTGRVAEGMVYAQRAAQQYHILHNYQREFRALLTLFTLGRQVGDYATVLDALDRAHACYEEGHLESLAFEALLNAETHIAWYRGNLEEALSRAQTWVRFAQGSGFHRQRLYANLVFGNIVRALGRYEHAFEAYETARRIAAEHMPNVIRWIDAQESWLALLDGELAEAEALIQRALTLADHGQRMSFQINLAVIEMLSGRWQAAEDHLRESLDFYTRSQDRQATCAISFHLAYLQLNQGGRASVVAKTLRPELKWLEACDNAFFPLWWHPGIIGRVAAFLLTLPEFHALGRRFFRQGYLGADGVQALRNAYANSTSIRRAEIAELLAAHGEPAPNDTPPHRNTDADSVIADAVDSGLVHPTMLPLLFQRFRTARQRDRNNPTVVAAFLLHIQGVSTGDIAVRLAASRSSVSHALQVAYESLGVPRDQGNRIEQRNALRQAAREQGLLP